MTPSCANSRRTCLLGPQIATGQLPLTHELSRHSAESVTTPGCSFEAPNLSNNLLRFSTAAAQLGVMAWACLRRCQSLGLGQDGWSRLGALAACLKTHDLQYLCAPASIIASPCVLYAPSASGKRHLGPTARPPAWRPFFSSTPSADEHKRHDESKELVRTPCSCFLRILRL